MIRRQQPRIGSQTTGAGCICWIGAVLLLGAATARGHDFWIKPTSFRPEPRRLIRVELLEGEQLRGVSLRRDPDRIERFFLARPESELDIVGLSGSRPAGMVRVSEPGTQVLAFLGKPNRVELASEKFEEHLKTEGLDEILAAYKTAKTPKPRVRESFQRCAKCLIRVGTSDTSNHDRVLGFPLEIVPEQDPYSLGPDHTISFRVVWEGKPLEGILVTALHEAGSPATQPTGQASASLVQGVPHNAEVHSLSARTGKDGRVTFPLRESGFWLINTVQMVASPDGSDVDYQSYWASLTFALPSEPRP